VGSHERVADPILVSCGWPRRLVRAGLRFVLACRHDVGHATGIPAADLRHPWERPAGPGRLTPARVRRGFRYLRAKTTRPTGAPKPGKPGPRRPPGSKNRRPATRHDVGKAAKRTRLRQEPQRRHFLQTAIDIIANRVAVEVDGRFGPTTAVMNFQTFLHTADAPIAVDGVVGSVMWRGIYYFLALAGKT
jgi:hypothetical protein